MPRAKSAKQMRTKEQLAQEYGAILFALKIWGDIDRNHKDGNARQVLIDRMAANGFVIGEVAFNNRMLTLVSKGNVSLLKERNKTYRINLLRIPEGTPNPYEGREGLPEVSDKPEFKHVTLNGYRELSIPERLAMVNELNEAAKKVNESILEDVATTSSLFTVAS